MHSTVVFRAFISWMSVWEVNRYDTDVSIDLEDETMNDGSLGSEMTFLVPSPKMGSSLKTYTPFTTDDHFIAVSSLMESLVQNILPESW